MNNISLTTLINKRAFDALKKITPLTVSLIRQERASNIWKLRRETPATESMEVFNENMDLLEEQMKEGYEQL